MKIDIITRREFLEVDVSFDYSLFKANKLFVEMLDYLVINK